MMYAYPRDYINYERFYKQLKVMQAIKNKIESIETTNQTMEKKRER